MFVRCHYTGEGIKWFELNSTIKPMNFIAQTIFHLPLRLISTFKAMMNILSIKLLYWEWDDGMLRTTRLLNNNYYYKDNNLLRSPLLPGKHVVFYRITSWKSKEGGETLEQSHCFSIKINKHTFRADERLGHHVVAVVWINQAINPHSTWTRDKRPDT